VRVMSWLLHAYAPFILKCIFETISNKKNHVYIVKCDVHTNLCMKNPITVWATKKTEFGAQNKAFCEICVIFNHKKSGFSETTRTQIDCHWSRCTCGFLCFNLTINIFFSLMERNQIECPLFRKPEEQKN
jgi:hypothetical protein